ncbi:dethiobiotin synthase [Leptothoe kymatousa]|uniref:ATP-dependent dethiobiotin synthetase BioD n=1 Tax=Leptothoe kymatousa TAU-MAC 1615 TaxID=2364775 RepID=A0ABS5Y0E3_9CYAN|nr:dethiobiotin synthase [Leptothoe kymatousa]MBT9311302.1 ATP-dependent dethiobiotin synthetase BioD [Leptothoe kymatousa TAU-MAC 1615]
MSGLLIAATDTACGKTVLTCALMAYWQKYCGSRRLEVLKPVQSGEGDRELYQRVFQLEQSLEELNPVFYQAPLAPPVAAAMENTTVDLAPAWQRYGALRQQCDWVLVEGLGGLGSPVTDEMTVADVASDWRLPVVLVVPVKLGAIAAAVANAALARQHRLRLQGIVLNCTTPEASERVEQLTPPDMISNLTRVPVLGVLPHFSDPTDLAQLSAAARQLSLEAIMPQAFWVA